MAVKEQVKPEAQKRSQPKNAVGLKNKFKNMKRAPLFFVLAIVFAGASAFLLKSVTSSSLSTGKAPPVVEATQDLIIAAVAIPAGSVLQREDVKTVPWPKAYYPKGNVFSKPNDILGHIARRDIYPDSPLFAEQLSAEASLGGLAVLIPKGMRAVTIAVTDVKGVAGFLNPGDKVDVLAHIDLDFEGERVKLSKTLLQNVLILAIDQSPVDERFSKIKGSKQSPEAPKTETKTEDVKGKPAKIVTLALLPEQVERVTLAEEMGSLRLALRAENKSPEELTLPNGEQPSEGITDTVAFKQPVLQALAPWFAAEQRRKEQGRSHVSKSKEKISEPVVKDQPQAETHVYVVEVINGIHKENVGF
jgi:pilus assembly protein CpaB